MKGRIHSAKPEAISGEARGAAARTRHDASCGEEWAVGSRQSAGRTAADAVLLRLLQRRMTHASPRPLPTAHCPLPTGILTEHRPLRPPSSRSRRPRRPWAWSRPQLPEHVRLFARSQDHRPAVLVQHAALVLRRRPAGARRSLAVGLALAERCRSSADAVLTPKAGRSRPSSTRCCSRCTPR